MILDLPKHQPGLVRKTNWKDEFRAQLYAKNLKVIEQAHQLNKKTSSKKAISSASQKIISILQRQTEITIIDKSCSQGCHSYYSSYIPVKEQTKFDDELETTFPYIKFLTEKGRTNDRHQVVSEIANHMKICRQKRMQQSGWKECLEMFICGIDTIRAIQLFLELKKKGTYILKDLHLRYGGACKINVFFHRISLAARYFGAHKEQKGAIMPLSLQATDQINESTMPKALKMLFCPVCLIYDCRKHSLDENVFEERNYQYLSPQNMLSWEEKLFSAIKLCLAHNELVSKNQLEREDPCHSTQCYKRLTDGAWHELARKRATLMSPLVKGLIKLGIQMHGYDPCKIWPLVHQVTPHKEQSKLNCALVFLFFIQEYDIYTRLERKLSNNEIDMLKKEMQGQHIQPEPLRRKMANKVVDQSENNQSLATCGHYFVGQNPCDQNCQACICSERGYCFPECLCSPNCPRRKKGCSCKRQDCRTKKCPCFNEARECEPSLCHGCFSDRSKCKNNAILMGRTKKVKVGRSTVPGAGLGLFAAQLIQKEEFVMTYAGQIIDPSVDSLRQSLSVDLSFYNFNSPEGIVDARFMGNASRFINHANEGQDNLRSVDMLSGARYRVAFFALRNILQGEELFFNYDGEGLLYKNHKEKYPFIRPSNKKGGKSTRK